MGNDRGAGVCRKSSLWRQDSPQAGTVWLRQSEVGVEGDDVREVMAGWGRSF